MDPRDILENLDEALKSGEIRTLTRQGIIVALATGGESGDETDHADVVILDEDAIKGLALCEVCEEFFPEGQVRESWEVEWEEADPGPGSTTRGNVKDFYMAKASRGASFMICPACQEFTED